MSDKLFDLFINPCQIWENLATCGLSESTSEYGTRGWVIVDVRDLSDWEQHVPKVKAKLHVSKTLLDGGARVIIRCHSGINRSNAIAVGVMMLCQPNGSVDASWDYHYRYLMRRCPRLGVVAPLARTVKTAVKELQDGDGHA